MALPANLPFKVYSNRSADAEAGYAPFFEAAFSTEDQAVEFTAEWNRLYQTTDLEFFLVK